MKNLLTFFIIAACSGPLVQAILSEGPDTYLDCVDDVQDTGLWYVAIEFDYASSGDKLPGLLHDKLQGDGIWYEEGRSVLFMKDLGVFMSPVPHHQTNYLYIKYYSHLHTDLPEKKIQIFPGLHPDKPDYNVDLPRTKDFIWNEVVVPLNESDFSNYYVGAQALKFDRDEYFVIEKMVIALGFNFTAPTVKDIKGLCGWADEVEPTTEKPKICTGEGKFPDPHSCDKFHVCQAYQGDYIDTVMTCPDKTNWCQRIERCEHPETCPCNL